MQITLNQAEVSQVVLDYVQNQLALDDSNTFTVELHEDGITVLVNEDSTETAAQPSTNERPAKKPRRTKAQIEADAKAEAERLAALDSGKSNVVTPTTSVVVAQATENAPVEAAGVISPNEVQSPGDEPEPETPVDPQPELDTPVDVAEPETPVEASNEEAEPELQPEPVNETPKPTQSLFANLRRPKN